MLLELCRREGGIRGDIALLFIAWIELFFNNDLTRAAALLDEAVARHERGALFHYLNGYLHRKQGRIAQATRAFERVRASAGDVRQLQLSALYELGWCAMLELRFADAIATLEAFLSATRSASFRAFAAFQLGSFVRLFMLFFTLFFIVMIAVHVCVKGVCCALCGRNDEATAAFSRVAG